MHYIGIKSLHFFYQLQKAHNNKGHRTSLVVFRIISHSGSKFEQKCKLVNHSSEKGGIMYLCTYMLDEIISGEILQNW